MKKIIKKTTTASEKVIDLPAPTKSEMCDAKCEGVKIDKLSCSFPSEDLNKVVEKINEIINKQNGN